MQIKNNTFVITGAAQGLGEAISVSLARQGAKLALLDVNAERLDQTLAACKHEGSDSYAFTCDVADETSVRRCFTSIEEHLGPISGLVKAPKSEAIVLGNQHFRKSDGDQMGSNAIVDRIK